MSDDDFFRTPMGHKFYEGDVPRIAKALERIADELKRQNDLKEKELEAKDDFRTTEKAV